MSKLSTSSWSAGLLSFLDSSQFTWVTSKSILGISLTSSLAISRTGAIFFLTLDQPENQSRFWPRQVVVYTILHLATKTPATLLSPTDPVAELNNPGFDLSLFEIWVTPIADAAIVVIPRHIVTDPNALPSFLEEHNVTVTYFTAALFETIALVSPKAFHNLRHVLLARDAATKRAIRTVLQEGPPQHLWNTYAPTQCTTFATMFDVTFEENPPRPHQYRASCR
jgi:hypothetical protein